MNTIYVLTENSIEKLKTQYKQQSIKTDIYDELLIYEGLVQKWSGKIWQSRRIEIWCVLTITINNLITAKFKIVNYNGKDRLWEKYIDKIEFEGSNLFFDLHDDNQSSNRKRYIFKSKDKELMNINQTIEKIKLIVEQSNKDSAATEEGGKRSRRKRRKISKKKIYRKNIKTISKKNRKNRRINKKTRKRSIKIQRR